MEPTRFAVEELEERFELASFLTLEEEYTEADAAEGGCCGGSCCIVGGNCGGSEPSK